MRDVTVEGFVGIWLVCALNGDEAALEEKGISVTLQHRNALIL